MKEKVNTKTTPNDLLDQTENQKNTEKCHSAFSEKYFTFFEHAPISLWIEDFSKVKTYIDTLVKKSNTDIKTYLTNNPNIIPKLVSLVTVKEVNKTAVKLYNAKSKEDLLNNLSKVFTENSNIGFSKLLIEILLGEKETEIETVNKTLDGEEINTLVKFNVVEGSEDTLENVIVSVENITDIIHERNALTTSEKRYREAQEVAKMGSWEYDFTTKKTHWSDEAYKLIGFKPEEKSPTAEFYLSYVHVDDRHVANDFSLDFLLKNPIQNLQYRITTADGELKHLAEKRTAVIENGRIVKIIGICQDITESVLAKQKLNTTKNLFSNTLSSINDGFVIVDYNSNYLFINEEAASLLNVKNPQDLIGKYIWTEFPEKEGDTFFDNYQQALKSRKPVRFENYFEPWNRWFENRIIPSKEGMLLFFHEITEKKASENKIKEAYNIINKSSVVAILCKNERDFPVEFSSENTLNLLGFSHTDLLTNKIKLLEVVHPDDLKFVRSEIIKFSKGYYSDSYKLKPFRIASNKGEIKWIQANIDAIRNYKNEITHIQGTGIDISDQKKTEDLLVESNQRLIDQFNNTPLASIIWDLNFKILEWNNAAERIFGYTVEEVKGKECKDLLTPPHLLGEMEILREKRFTQKESFVNTNENITKNGKIITCEWYRVTLKDAEGNLTGSACLVEDITERINAKKIIERSEKKYRDIFEKTIDAVLILKEGVLVDCNESTLKMFGYNKKQSLLKLHPSKLSPETQKGGESSFLKAERLMKIALDKGSNRFRWDHQQKNGHVFPAEVSLTRIDEIDSIPTIHAIVKDITERVKIEALEDVLYNISKAALTISDFKEFGFFIKNELHKIINTNNFYIALYNEGTDMISTPVFVDEKEEVEDFPAKNSLTGYVIKTKKPLLLTKEEHSQLIKQGGVSLIGDYSECWLGVPLLINNNSIGAIVVQSYNNKDAYTENDVQLLEFVADQINTTIQRKKAENELKNALLKAQESEKLKSAFLANMSHEIRTPMNGIIGFSELFLESNLSDKERKKYANIVINSSKQLLAIVNDILDISKIEAGAITLNYESVNLNKMLDDLKAFYKPRAINGDLELRCVKELGNFDSIIEIDKTKLTQVLNNLLSNAFKFTDEGSIEFGYKHLGSMLQFYVKDTGVGIEENLQNQIFDRFIQANIDLVKKHKGTGLGLAISKKFIELFKGEIWIDSNNEGTTIYFTIPYIKSKTSLITSVVEEKKSAIQVKNQELTILVAEDEEYNMMYINELFSKTKFKIIEADNGKKAVELTDANPEINLVLMDIKMPIMDGNEAMKEIKKKNPLLPIIALSAFAMESDKKDALKMGFDAYLTKPIDKKLLFEIIGKYAN